jgi:hypothetical protein
MGKRAFAASLECRMMNAECRTKRNTVPVELICLVGYVPVRTMLWRDGCQMRKALLVRIGVDQAFGGWNGPVDSEGNFIFVPIPEKMGAAFHKGLERRYEEVTPSLDRFCRERGKDLCLDLKFPTGLGAYPMHLDPDFEQLTYGDDGGRRGAGMTGMMEGDLLVSYSGL